MANEYTRQRQGRDFFNHLANAEMSVEANFNNIDGIVGNAPPKDDSEEKRNFLDRLDYFKAEAERAAVPIDGHEPVTERIR
jgi:hypothetical protein